MEKKHNSLSILNIILTIIILLLIAAIVIFVVVISPMTVSGPSMQNTLHDGDRIWVLKTDKDYQVGDVIVFKNDEENNIVKRIIAKGGDTIRFDFEKGYIVNNEVLDEEYIKNKTYNSDYFAGNKQDIEVYKWLTTSGLTLKEDELFVLGDNSNSHMIVIDMGQSKLIKLKEKCYYSTKGDLYESDSFSNRKGQKRYYCQSSY